MKDKSRGFSLVEVTLVLLIMSLVAVAAIPSMKNIRKQEVDQFAKVLALDLVEQRSQQKVNSMSNFQLELISNSDGKFCGYQLKNMKDASDPQVYKTQFGETSHIEVIILNEEGHKPEVPIQRLSFNGDTLKSLEVPQQDYTMCPLKIQVEQESCSVVLEFDYLTGWYQMTHT